MKLIKAKDIIIIILVLSLVFLYYGKQRNHQENSNIERQQRLLEQRVDNLRILSKLQHYGEGKSIKDIYLYTLNKDSVLFSRLIGNENKLVFYFSEFGCSSCYLPFLQKLSKIDKKLKNSTIIIADFNSARDFKIFKNEHKIEVPVYRIKTNLGLYPEYNDYALAFLISERMIIDNLMIIDYSNRNYIDDYLAILESKI